MSGVSIGVLYFLKPAVEKRYVKFHSRMEVADMFVRAGLRYIFFPGIAARMCHFFDDYFLLLVRYRFELARRM